MQNYGSGGVSNNIANLGKGLGLAAALLGTPAIYVRTRAGLMTYYGDAFGHSAAQWLTWATGLVEAYLLYAVVSLAFTGLVTWMVAKRAVDSFGG